MDMPLPKFEKPPVVEVALSVQFDRLNVTTAHLGLVWQQFRKRFPRVEEKVELDTAIELFDLPKKLVPEVRLEVRAVPFPRLWFVSESGCELVQVQRNRFIRNWRKTEGNPEYPRYETLRQSFVDDWELFVKFISEETKASVSPNQCEVTYVNILEDLHSGELSKAIAWVGGECSDGYLQKPEDAELTLRYVLRDGDERPWGRLHIVATPAIRASDSKPVVRLALTARGAPGRKDTSGAIEWLNKGHEAVVRGFTSITTSEMHAAWERQV